jgi:hypothetical protein
MQHINSTFEGPKDKPCSDSNDDGLNEPMESTKRPNCSTYLLHFSDIRLPMSRSRRAATASSRVFRDTSKATEKEVRPLRAFYISRPEKMTSVALNAVIVLAYGRTTIRPDIRRTIVEGKPASAQEFPLDSS